MTRGGGGSVHRPAPQWSQHGAQTPILTGSRGEQLAACSRLTDRPLRMIRRLFVRILWNVAFQTLKGRGGRHGNGTGGWRWGVPRERKGQQNVKHLQLCKGEEETCMSLPTKRAGGGPVTASSGRPRGTHACRSRKAEWAEEAQVLAFALEGTRCHDLRSRVQSRVWGRGH